MKLSQLIVSFLMISNKIFIEAAIKRNTNNNNHLNVKQLSAPVVDVDANYGRAHSDKMKAMLMKCPGNANDDEKGHDLCQDKILVTIGMEEKVAKGDESMGSSNLLVLEDNFRGKTKAKLLIPSFIDTKRTFPVLLYPMEVRMMSNFTPTRCGKLIDAHPFKTNDVNKIAHKYFSLDAIGNTNPFVGNNHQDEPHLNEDVFVQKRQRDSIRACQCNSCPEIAEDESGCHNCQKQAPNESNSINDDQLFPTKNEDNIHHFASLKQKPNKKTESHKRVANGNGILDRNNELKIPGSYSRANYIKSNSFVGQSGKGTFNQYEDSSTIKGKITDFPRILYREPKDEEKDVNDDDRENYLDYYGDVPSLSDPPSWSIADSANSPDKNDAKPYDALMMDDNLTPNDKIQFLAANFDHPRPIYDHYMKIQPLMRKKRSAFYDDMTPIDDNILENSKYNGDWYRYLIANFPQLSEEKANINNGQRNNDKSVPLGKAKNVSKEQKSHSVEKLCTERKCVLAIPVKKENYFSEAKQCLEKETTARKHLNLFLTLCQQDAIDYIVVPYGKIE